MHPCSPSYSGGRSAGCLEPRSVKLQYTMIVPLHYGLGNKARLCLKKKMGGPGAVTHACHPSTL